MTDAFPQQRKSKKQHRKKRLYNIYKRGGPLRTRKKKKKIGKSKK